MTGRHLLTGRKKSTCHRLTCHLSPVTFDYRNFFLLVKYKDFIQNSSIFLLPQVTSSNLTASNFLFLHFYDLFLNFFDITLSFMTKFSIFIFYFFTFYILTFILNFFHIFSYKFKFFCHILSIFYTYFILTS